MCLSLEEEGYYQKKKQKENEKVIARHTKLGVESEFDGHIRFSAAGSQAANCSSRTHPSFGTAVCRCGK
jgi:hypothetical protein